MGVLVREIKGKPGFWVRISYRSRRAQIHFHDRTAAEEAARTLEVQFALDNFDFDKSSKRKLTRLEVDPLKSIDIKYIEDTEPCVYFIQLGKHNPIKIGYTTNIHKRLKDVRTLTTKEIRVLALVPGWGKKEEQALHQLFQEHRIAREWFRPAANLLFFIRYLQFIWKATRKNISKEEMDLNEDPKWLAFLDALPHFRKEKEDQVRLENIPHPM